MTMKLMTCRSLEKVQCQYVLTSGQEDAGQVLTLELHSAMRCEDGNFTIYDGKDVLLTSLSLLLSV